MNVKICGVTRPQDAETAARFGATAVGLNFYPGSPRHVSVERAREILRVLPERVKPVAVLVAGQDNEAQLLKSLHEELGLTRFQFHGDAAVARLRGLPRPGDVWSRVAAFAVATRADLDAIAPQVGPEVSAVLVDAKVAGRHGGTGRTAPWDLLAGFDPGVPVLLAGGLTAENVAEAIARARPFAVDVASGVESEPGVKDEEKLRRFMERALG